MKKVLLIILVLCGALGAYAQNNVYGKKVVGLDSVVTNSINAKAGDVVTVLKALAVDGPSAVQATFDGTGLASNAGIRISTDNNVKGFIQFGDTDDVNIGAINYDHANEDLEFITSNGERMSISNTAFSVTPDATFTGDVETGGKLSVVNGGTASTTEELWVSNGDAGFATVATYRDNVSDNTLLGSFATYGEDDGDNETRYGRMAIGQADVTDATEDGYIEFQTISGGTEDVVSLTLQGTDATFSGDVTIGTDTNSDSLTFFTTEQAIATQESLGKISWSVHDNSAGRLQQEGAYIKFRPRGTWNASASPSYISFGIVKDGGATTDFIDDVFTINEDSLATFKGALELSAYGSGSNTGTAAYGLAVTADGDVIENSNVVTTGSYTPTISNTSNISGTPNILVANYVQTGNIYQISIQVVYTATSTGATSLKLSLPNSETIDSNSDVGGVGVTRPTVFDTISCTGDASTDTIFCNWSSSTSGAKNMTVNVMVTVD
jgi:hypothetical protein